MNKDILMMSPIENNFLKGYHHNWHSCLAKNVKKFESLKKWGLHYFIVPFCISKIAIIAK
jgi:hypothetical protein